MGTSKSHVSRPCEEIDERVNAVFARPIEGSWLLPLKRRDVREGRQAGKIVSVAVIIAVAVDTDARREVLGLDVLPKEAEPLEQLRFSHLAGELNTQPVPDSTRSHNVLV